MIVGILRHQEHPIMQKYGYFLNAMQRKLGGVPSLNNIYFFIYYLIETVDEKHLFGGPDYANYFCFVVYIYILQ